MVCVYSLYQLIIAWPAVLFTKSVPTRKCTSSPFRKSAKLFRRPATCKPSLFSIGPLRLRSGIFHFPTEIRAHFPSRRLWPSLCAIESGAQRRHSNQLPRCLPTKSRIQKDRTFHCFIGPLSLHTQI